MTVRQESLRPIESERDPVVRFAGESTIGTGSLAKERRDHAFYAPRGGSAPVPVQGGRGGKQASQEGASGGMFLGALAGLSAWGVLGLFIIGAGSLPLAIAGATWVLALTAFAYMATTDGGSVAIVNRTLIFTSPLLIPYILLKLVTGRLASAK